MKIGLSYDEGEPVYRFYVGALMAAAEQAAVHVEPLWLAGADRPTDEVAITSMDGLILTGGADVEPQHYGFDDPQNLCKPCLLYTSPSPRDPKTSRMPSSA